MRAMHGAASDAAGRQACRAERRVRRRGRVARVALLTLPLAAASGCGPGEIDPARHAAVVGPPNPTPGRCDHYDPLRSPWFGDLHVHTALSPDAWGGDLRVGPEGAYRYAFGEPIALPPLSDDGQGTREVRIDRPLDFAGVTDHAEYLGEMALCADPDSGVFDAGHCETLRSGNPTDPSMIMHIMTPFPWRDDAVCDEDGGRCRRAAGLAWQRTIDAAQAWNDPTSACERTTFVAYEYSSFRLGSNLHRNVIFRNASVLALPISYNETAREWVLWRHLQELCIDSDTSCDVLAIPHNSNIGNGRMFAVDYPGASTLEEQAARATLRAAIEPIVEIMQHKGDSECRPEIAGVLGAPDELCAFEKFEDRSIGITEYSDADACGDGALADWTPHLGPDCVSPGSYVRYTLTEGLREEARLGINPFKLGLMASTDTHNAIAGGVDERTFPGHLGVVDDTVAERVSDQQRSRGNAANGPGGLVAVWAEENSRDALFDAMRRREVYGTSGPRITVRFFGGELPDDLCGDPDLVARAYAAGVPMGADLPGGSTDPAFLVLAQRDPGSADAPGGLLQRVQIVKGWVDDDGALHQQVFDVAGGANDADVDLATCRPRGAGHDRLCSVWRDPDFAPERRAVYYARVLENPSCRYSHWQCIDLPESARPPECATSTAPKAIQERAWTSPIWYTPEAG
jgi:hypothetical protein